jgi:CheY-like chemotaxis protein/anti-sigma regulatory factor (Ser/Thr protein kinase)
MKVLVVDDHSYNRELLGFILDDHQYPYSTAADGAEAVEAVVNDPDIDAVLMDVNMPVMDGYDATRLIKEKCAERFIPIIFVTALDDDETLAKCLSVGGNDFVPKPINESVLIAKLSAHSRTINYHRQLQDTNEKLSYHQRLMEREHSIVEHVFQNGMKRVDNACDNVNYHISPMSMFNGDLLLVAPGGKGGIYILLGDFTGHGLSAAIGCLPVSDIFYAMTAKQAGVGEIAREMNLRLQDLLPSNMFCCAALIEMNAKGDRLTLWVGGMNDLLLVKPEGGILERIPSQHMPLGILATEEFEADVDIISPPENSILLAYTDGVVEAQKLDGELYGEERLQKLLEHPADSYTQKIAAEVLAFQAGEEQTDDISMVELLCAPVTHDGVVDAERFTVQCDDDQKALPFRFHWHLDSEALRRDDAVSQWVAILNANPNLRNHSDVLFTLLSEIYSNAVEHGLLKLNSELKSSPEGFEEYYSLRKQALDALIEGRVDLEIEIKAGDCEHLWITMTDTGEGFDYQNQEEIEEEDEFSFGRGMTLIRSLVETCEYSNGGRTLTLSYPLQSL